MRYELTVYRWLTCSGSSAESELTMHDTFGAALTHLATHGDRYWLATVYIRDQWGGLHNCDAQGRMAGSPFGDGPPTYERHGYHREHPTHVRLRLQWPHLVAEVMARGDPQHRGMIAVAGDVLAQYGFALGGIAHDLAEAALDGETAFRGLSTIFARAEGDRTPAAADVLRIMADYGCPQDVAVIALGGNP